MQGIDPCLGNLILHAEPESWHSQIKKKNKTKTEHSIKTMGDAVEKSSSPASRWNREV